MTSIHLDNVSLDYIIKTGSDSLKKTLLHLCNGLLGKKSIEEKTGVGNSCFRALNGINLQINKGDRIGLLGKNGAGKSTLLRVLAKIYQPSYGSIKVNGNISNLFDVNLGLNIEATGYENIINLGILRGWSKKEAFSVVDEVQQFTELGDFLANPVRTYSSGMQMKLAFAVATSRAPEIMLVDEFIGVGDAHFMEKAKQRIENMIDKTNILVLTSHSIDIIKQFCNKVIVLDCGEIKYFGDYQQGIDFYENIPN